MVEASKSANEPRNEPRNDIERQILEFIGSNSKISYDDLAQLTQKGRSSIMRTIARLKSMGLLKRVGPKKGGHWETIK